MKTKKLTNDKQSVITKRDTMTMRYKTQETQTKKE